LGNEIRQFLFLATQLSSTSTFNNHFLIKTANALDLNKSDQIKEAPSLWRLLVVNQTRLPKDLTISTACGLEKHLNG